MYVSKGVSREEWMWRGLAIAMCLAMVGMVVMPVVYTSTKVTYVTYIADRTGFSKEHPYLTTFISSAAGSAASGGIAVITAAAINGADDGAEAGALIGGLIGAVVGAVVGAAAGVA